MAAASGRNQCFTCRKERTAYKCEGCSKFFCFNHLHEHRQQLSKELDEIVINCDLTRQTILEQKNEPQKHPLIREINQWEENAIQKIRQTAEEARRSILKGATMYHKQIEEKLNRLTDELRINRQEDDLTETDLLKWQGELAQLTEKLTKPSNVNVRYSSTPLISDIVVNTVGELIEEEKNISNLLFSVLELFPKPDVFENSKWLSDGVVVAGGNGRGSELNQLSGPYGIYVDEEQNVYVADTMNNRIVEWKSSILNGKVLAGGNGQGKHTNQLCYPKDVIVNKRKDYIIVSDSSNRRIVRWSYRNNQNGETVLSDINCIGISMDKDECLYITDHGEHEVRRYKIGEKTGTVVAGGNGKGSRLDQLDAPYFSFVDQEYSVYISEHANHRVTKWTKGAKEGIVVAGGQGQGSDLNLLSHPYGLFVDHLGTVYVADYGNHRIMRWLKGATSGSVIVGESGRGSSLNQVNNPTGLTMDSQNNLYVVDSNNSRVLKFQIDSTN